jgi:hypothetical protein
LSDLIATEFFPKPLLDFAYDLLVSVDSGGYLFANGDMDAYPALALQASSGLRPDVTIVSIPLLSRPWYVKYLKRERRLPTSFTNAQLDALAPRYDPKLDRIVTPAELVLRDVIGNRDHVQCGFYFALTVRREVLEAFKFNLSLEGFVYRVTGNRRQIPVNADRAESNLGQKYRIPDFSRHAVWQANSSPLTRDYSALAVDCAAAYWALADEYQARNEIGRASGFCRQACSILVRAGKWDALERILNYWLKIAPQDTDALRLKVDYYGK